MFHRADVCCSIVQNDNTRNNFQCGYRVREVGQENRLASDINNEGCLTAASTVVVNSSIVLGGIGIGLVVLEVGGEKWEWEEFVTACRCWKWVKAELSDTRMLTLCSVTCNVELSDMRMSTLCSVTYKVELSDTRMSTLCNVTYKAHCASVDPSRLQRHAYVGSLKYTLNALTLTVAQQ